MTEQLHEHHPLTIIGGGIGGLTLALCLDQAYNHSKASRDANNNGSAKMEIHVYESTQAYTKEAGGAIGLYPNGLRVLKNLSNGFSMMNDTSAADDAADNSHIIYEASAPNLLSLVREAGCPYIYRRWMRHDGTEVAVAREDELLPDVHLHCNDDNSRRDRDTSNDAHGNEKQQQQQYVDPSKLRSRTNSLAGKAADTRPRGGSIRLVKDTVDGFRHRLSRLSLVSDTSTATTASSSSASTTTTTTTNSNDKKKELTTQERDLLSLGIRRWKYQQVLYEACQSVGIVIHFGKRLQSVSSCVVENDEGDDSRVKSILTFKDGSTVSTSLLIGADGINSKVREYIVSNAKTTQHPNATKDDTETQKGSSNSNAEEYTPEYTGVTCLMGCANVPRMRGICFPSSATTKCHACYYPTRVPDEDDAAVESTDEEQNTEEGGEPTNSKNDESKYEQVFQIYFPSPIERPDTWRTLTPDEAKTECRNLANKLRQDGWDEQFLKPLESETLTGVLRVGLRSRTALDVWYVGGSDEGKSMGRAVLLGDAAHPPVPYIGQGAMMAMEDAGTLSLVLARFCPLGADGTPDYTGFGKAMEIYEELRVNRTKTILGSSVQLGKTQQKRADSKLYNAYREWSIKTQVWLFGTLPVMRPGAAFNYVDRVEEVLSECMM